MKRGFLKGPKATKAMDSGNTVQQKTFKPTKFSHGVVEEAGRPEGYTSPKIKSQEYDGNTIDYPDDHMIGTTQPSQSIDATLADEPDGWSQCYITGFAKRQILSTPGFPKPIARRSTPVHKIVDVPGKGLGIFATQDLQPGDLIFAERPILVLPKAVSLPIGIPDHFSSEQGRQALLYEWEKTVIEPLFARAAPELQKAYLELHNAHQFDGSGSLTGISRTNGFALGLRDKGKPHETNYSGTVKDGSRFNHSCMPNVTNAWDMASFSIQFRALCAIKAGEELTVPYCIVNMSAAKRQEKLEPYGFQCTCPACQNPAVSDPRRMNYSGSMPHPIELVMWACNPRAPDDEILDRLLEQVRICEEERLYVEPLPTQAYLDLLVMTYCLLADEENAVKYGRMLGEQVLAHTGDDSKLKEFSRIEHYRKQPLWGYRKHPSGQPPTEMMQTLEYAMKFLKEDPDGMKPKCFMFPGPVPAGSM